jgi:hypothetical protein
MREELLKTVSPNWVKLKATNFTDTSFAARKSTLTEPTGDGVVDLSNPGQTSVQNGVMVKFFGTDANNENFKVRIYGWHRCLTAVAGVYSWEHILLADLACTLGNLAGVASGSILDTDFEVDTITEVTACNVDLVSPASDIRGAHVMLDVKGASKIEFLFDRNSSAASANALYRLI